MSETRAEMVNRINLFWVDFQPDEKKNTISNAFNRYAYRTGVKPKEAKP